MERKLLWMASLALLTCLMITGKVFAEGEEPPVVPGVVLDEITDSVSVEEPVEAVESAVNMDEVLSDGVTDSELVDAPVEFNFEETSTQVTEELPTLETVETAIVTTEGNPLILATQESATLLENADPYFTVGATKYCFVPLTGTCDISCGVCEKSATPIQASIDYINTNGTVPTDGCIYVEKATYAGNVSIDGSLLYLNSLSGLTGLPDPSNIFPTIGGSLTIRNMDYGFSLLGFNVTGGVNFYDNEGPISVESVSGSLLIANSYVDSAPNDGIRIKDHKGNITVTESTANYSTGRGLNIENQISGNVTISNSGFYDNMGRGVAIESRGVITINNISSELNYIGISVSNVPFSSLTIKNSNINDNYLTGIYVDSVTPGKPVTLENITANSNGDVDHATYKPDGIRLLNVGNVVAKNITVNENLHDGINILSTGTVTLTSITANINMYDGIDIVSPNKVVSINGAVTYSNNSSTGIFIASKGVTLRNIVSQNNATEGILLDMYGGTALMENIAAIQNGKEGIRVSSEHGGVVMVTLKNSVANNNQNGGVTIDVYGAVNISNLTTNENTYGNGLFVYTNNSVIGTDLSSSKNEWNGIYIRTRASISLSNIFAYSNIYSGADLDNCLYDDGSSLCLGTGGITVKNSIGMMNDLSFNGRFGLWAVSKGAISITNLRANDNDSDGALIANLYGGSTAPITVQTLGTVRNDFSGNGKYLLFHPAPEDYYMVLNNGISALSAGNITVRNTDAYSNGSMGGGIYLDAKFTSALRTVTLANSTTGENDWVGVWIFSRGNIVLADVTANNNSQGGIHIDNCIDYLNGVDEVCIGVGSIKLTRIDVNDNAAIGLEAISKGTITLNTVNAYNNWSIGINLNNAFIGSTAGVSAANIFASNNNENGFSINTNGSVVLANITTNNNAKLYGGIGEGQTVQDFFNGSLGPDTWWFDAEYDMTYTVVLRADVSWGLNRASFNPWIELYDAETEMQIPVAITCFHDDYCTFDFLPYDYGYLSTHSYFMVVGSDSNDGFYRLSLNDSNPDDSTVMFFIGGTGITAGGNIKVTTIESHSNSLIGLGATTMQNGSITLSNLRISENGAEGVYLTLGQDPYNFYNAGFGTGTTSIAGINYINDNGWEGLIIQSSGAINFKNLDIFSNGDATGGDGIRIYDDHALKTATLLNVNSSENGGRGIWLISTGNISLTKVHANHNYGSIGIYLDNCLDNGGGTCVGTGSILLSGVDTNDNQGCGLEAYSKGTITAKTINASGNRDRGATFYNQYNGTSSGINLAYVTANYNGNSGISINTNGALVMSNINASSNANIWNGIGADETVQDFYNKNKGPDHWFFDAQEGVPYTLLLQADGYGNPGLLNRYPFDPYMELYTADGVQITSGFSIAYITDDYYEITWTPGFGEGGSYYMQISSNSFDGFYRVSVNDTSPEYADRYYFVNGLGYNVGGNVTLSGTNILNDNAGAGLIGWSNGSVALSNINTIANGAEGIYVDNQGGSGNVTISGTNLASWNGWEGLRIDTNGAVIVSNLGASYNGQNGVRIGAHGAAKPVTLNNITAFWNAISGLDLEMDGGTHGITTLTNIRAWFNAEDGMNVNTNYYKLSLVNSSFMCNSDDGFVYWGYPAPFTFVNINNIFLGNGDHDLLQK